MNIENIFQNKKKTVLWNLMMFIEMLASAVVIPFIQEGRIHPVSLVFAAVLSVGAAVYAFLFESKLAESLLFWLTPLVYLISVVLLLLFDHPLMFPFWTFGGLLLLCAFKLRYGMFLNIFLLFVLGSMQTKLFSEALLIQLLCLLLFGFAIPFAKVWKDAVNILISVAAVLVSVRIVCYFTIDKSLLNLDIFSVATVYAIVIFAVLMLSKVLRNIVLLQEQKESFDYLEELAVTTEEQGLDYPADILKQTEVDVSLFDSLEQKEPDRLPELSTEEAAEAEEKTEQEEAVKTADLKALNMQLDLLCEETAPLLLSFSQKYPEVFLHVRRVALIAFEVADRLTGVNSSLVKCAGYYHEIGRLRGERSLQNTLEVAREEGFPDVLQNLLREHTVGGDRPSTKEAAIVLLTDNICGLCEHLRKTQKGRILVTKVIDKAIEQRLIKGDLNQSGLTVEELSQIRNALADVIKEDMF